MHASLVEVKEQTFLTISDIKKERYLQEMLQCQFDLYVNQSNKHGESWVSEQR